MRLFEKILNYYKGNSPQREVKEEKPIRTYKGKTVIDHRTNKMYLLERIINGELDEIHKDL